MRYSVLFLFFCSAPITNPKRQRTSNSTVSARASHSTSSHSYLDRFALRPAFSSSRAAQSSSSSSSCSSGRQSSTSTKLRTSEIGSNSGSHTQRSQLVDRAVGVKRLASAVEHEDHLDDYRSPSKDLVTPARAMQARHNRRAQLSQSFHGRLPWFYFCVFNTTGKAVPMNNSETPSKARGARVQNAYLI